MDIYQMDPAILQERIQGRGHRPGSHGLTGLEDLVLAGITKVWYDQGDPACPANIQEL
jgi:hypothetical protein